MYHFALRSAVLFGILAATSCQSAFNQRIEGEAYLVNNHRDKQPLGGVFFEVFYYQESVRDDEPFAVATTDERGYFKIDGVSTGGGGFDIDGRQQALVYTDLTRSDTLGTLQFAFPGNDTYRYQMIHLDTFALPHRVWMVPRIASLGSNAASEFTLHFYFKDGLCPTGTSDYPITGPLSVGQKLDAYPATMDLANQHWLAFGTRTIGSAYYPGQVMTSGSVEVPFGLRTAEGDTVYLDVVLK
ncbi:MAG: hypothetical protein RL558_111 [Bacteroidota bacterium]|jgi:hypothetical protein